MPGCGKSTVGVLLAKRLGLHFVDTDLFIQAGEGKSLQRLIEIFSDHRRSEAWANTFLAAGHRLGIMASTDNHYGNPGYGYLKILHDWQRQEIGTSAMAVYAADRTRRGPPSGRH